MIPRRRKRSVLLVLMALIAPLLGAAALLAGRAAERERARARFEQMAVEQATAIEAEVDAGTEMLHALRAFFESSKEVTREEFATFTADTLGRRGEIQALEWAPRVPAAKRTAFVEAARARDFAEFAITHRDADGHMAPAPAAAVNVPVRFVEPHEGNESGLGFDLASEGVRHRALQRAWESRETVMTDPITLVQEQETSRAVLVVLAVEARAGSSVATEPPSDGGYVVLVWRMQDLIAKVVRTVRGPVRAGMRFTLLDPDAPERPLYTTVAAGPEGQADDAESATVNLAVAGQHWRLRAVPTALFLKDVRSDRPWLIGGLVFLLAQALYITLVVRSASARDRMQRKQMRMLGVLLRSLDEGVVVTDTAGRIRIINEAAKRLVGDFGEDLPHKEWAGKIGCFLPDGRTPYDIDKLPLARAMRGGHPADEQVFVRNAQVPEGRLLRVNGAPLQDEAGTRRGGVIVLHDITEHRKAQNHVQRLSNAVEQTADAVFITDRTGKFLYVNPAFTAITGYTKEEVDGQTPRMLKSGLHEQGHYKGLWSKVLAGKVWRGTTVNRRKSGSLFHSEQTVTPMLDAEGEVTHFVSVCKDLTEKQRRMEQDAELKLAGLVQQRLYPTEAPRFDGLEIAGSAIPAEATCGDYFDYIDLPDGRLGIAIGDISGHGFGPALLMAETRAYLRSMLTHKDCPEELFRSLNQSLLADLADDKFVTLLYASINPRSRELLYVNAGHPAAYVLDRQGEVRSELNTRGVALGILEDRDYTCSDPIILEVGDLIVFLTDGITEALSPEGEPFEEERVLEVVRIHCQEPVDTILAKVHESVQAFVRDRIVEDDQTMVICRVTESEGRSASYSGT